MARYTVTWDPALETQFTYPLHSTRAATPDMNRLAEQLDKKLQTLDPVRAQYLESLVREAFDKAEQQNSCGSSSGWPAEYFEQTAGALTGEDFQRSPQGEFPRRDDW